MTKRCAKCGVTTSNRVRDKDGYLVCKTCQFRKVNR